MKIFTRRSARIILYVLGTVSVPSYAGTAVGNIGVFSEYLFRGIVAEGGAAVQGGVDYYHDSGLFAGTWVSNSNPFGGNEWDLYGGYAYQLRDKLSIDVGVLHYVFTEDDQADGAPDLDTTEFFVGLNAGPLKVQAYYSDDYVSTGDDGEYYSATFTQQINDTISVVLQLGYTGGDGPKAVYGDDYLDYSVAVNKTLREGLVFALTFVDTDLGHEDVGSFVDAKDKPKAMVSLKQTFPF